MEYYIGIDGGGTKTELVITDTTGRLIKRAIAGSSNPNDIGVEKCVLLIEKLIENNLPDDCLKARLCAGISGCNAAGCKGLLTAKIKDKFPFIDKIIVGSDIMLNCGCMDGDEFCFVIIGTGSVVVVKQNGETFIIGGGGYLIDEDLSGFSLGRQALNCILSAEDGRGEQTILKDLFYKETGYNEKKGFRYTLKDVYNRGKMYIASFAPMVFEGYKKGDNVSENILSESVRNFEKLVMGGYKRLNKKHIKVSVFGGLSSEFSVLQRFLSEDIKEKIDFVVEDTPVIFGALKLIDDGCDNNFKNNFLNDYKNK